MPLLQIKLINKLTYKLKLSPQMKLNINLLQLPLIKLKEFIEQEIEQNPLLDIENVKSLSESEGKFESELRIIKNTIESSNDGEFSERGDYNVDDEEKQNYKESLLTSPPSLGEHLLEQLRLCTNYGPDREIGELIIGNIDDNGYLRSSIEDIAKSVKTHVARVEKVLFLIQTFDPVGIGARDLRECLLIQLKVKGKENSLEEQIVDNYLPYLEKKRFNYIAKKLRVSVETIKEAMKEIAKLAPKPGNAITKEKVRYLIPDAILREAIQVGHSREYEIILNNRELPRLNLNVKYINMIQQKNTPPEVKEYLIKKLKSAQALIYGVNKRNETIHQVIENIIYIQKEFFNNGTGDFKPMTLEQIAKQIKKHKSTVSRAVTNKYLQTPWGIYELRSFLNSGVKQSNGKPLSSKTIKLKIKEMIENENKESPLSDLEIVKNLKQSGIFISRRTIAKYRTQLRILPSKLRRE